MKIKIIHFITNSIKWVKRNIFNIVGVLIMIVIILFYFLITKDKGLNYNLSISTDSVYVKPTKSGKEQYIAYEKKIEEQSKEIKKLAAELLVKPTEIIRTVEITAQSDLSKVSKSTFVKVDTIYIDSSKLIGKLYSVSNKYVQRDALVTDSSIEFIKDIHNLYLTGAFTEVKENGIKYNQFRVIPEDSFTIIKELRNNLIRKEPEYSRWAIGPAVGVTYYDNKVIPVISFGVQYNLKRFKK